ncbi:DUF6345 domain-containing protein [Pseudooceanicola sp. HF7]|uniref:DUF6345 domain-containing protein n=1 Tax=Pseudooceanicola sp. HF7 TaxID=2721560 RepID=UPI00142FA5C0|nr:DUF6345 domain-containing protein [Pseudooceanicola sp. HF7]NIZ07935.1 hypothetical protein [Pseudooceanicola sp. HF7]
MARRMGSWWIKDGVDGRRIEAQSFASTFDMVAGYDWSEDHGDSAVLEKDFVVTANYDEKSDNVDCLMMSSHGSPGSFSVWDGAVSTSDSIDFGAGDLEVWASHACQVLRHDANNSTWDWIPAWSRLHYMCGFHTNSFSGGGRDKRGFWFAWYGGVGHALVPFFYSHNTIRSAWKKANRMVEGSNVDWAYMRASGNTSGGSYTSTYNEKFRTSEPSDPVTGRTFFWARGTC